jgi:hypothetical protein
VSITTDHILQGTQACKSCDVLQPLGQFDRHSQSGNLRSVCKRCRIQQINRWQQANREQTRVNQRAYNRRWHGRAVVLFNAAKARANNKGDPFLLTLDDVKAGIALGKCQKTGVDFELQPYGDSTQSPYAPSIDKIDPKGFYEPNNVQYVCFWYNGAKQQWSDELVLEMCKRLLSQ